jgi:hemerythrin superfamily protein
MNKAEKPATKQAKVDYSEGEVQQILHEDHEKVDDLFFQFSQEDDDTAKADLVETIIKELYMHATVEEELVYPVVRKDVEDSEEMMDEADTEHSMIKVLLSQLQSMKPGDDHYDAKVTVLGELVKHHVREEEKEMFKEIHESDIGAEALGAAILLRKKELQTKAVPKINPATNTAESKKPAQKAAAKKSSAKKKLRHIA